MLLISSQSIVRVGLLTSLDTPPQQENADLSLEV